MIKVSDYLASGRLCPSSFASDAQAHVVPLDPPVAGWGACRMCGEVVNTRSRFIPEHRVP